MGHMFNSELLVIARPGISQINTPIWVGEFPIKITILLTHHESSASLLVNPLKPPFSCGFSMFSYGVPTKTSIFHHEKNPMNSL